MLGRRSHPGHRLVVLSVAAVVVSSVTERPGQAAMAVSGSSGQGRLVVPRGSVCKWLSSFTDLARRMHGELPALVNQICTPLPLEPVPIPTGSAPEDDQFSLRAPLPFLSIDLPPPAPIF